MTQKSRSGWALLALLGFILYLLKACVCAVLQYGYFVNPEEGINAPQVLKGLLEMALRKGLLGLSAVISIYATLIAAYFLSNSLLMPERMKVRPLLIAYAAIQFLLGNTGFIAGLALIVTAAILAGESNGVKTRVS